MQGRTLRSMPRQLCEAFTVRCQLERSRASRSVAATVSDDVGDAGDSGGGNTRMGGSIASLDRLERSIKAQTIQRQIREADFALIGNQESWRAAADVLSVLRGRERAPLPDEDIKDILPWIPPRAVCHVEVGSIFNTKIGKTRIGSAKIVGTKAHGLYIDSFIPPDRLEAAYVHENIARVRAAAACAITAGANIVSLGLFNSITTEF